MKRRNSRRYWKNTFEREEIFHEVAGIFIGMVIAVSVLAVVTVIGLWSINKTRIKEQQGVLLSENKETEENELWMDTQSTKIEQEKEINEEPNKENQEEQKRQMQNIAMACENSYHASEKGRAINVTLSESDQKKMVQDLAKAGYAIATTGYSSNLANYESVRDKIDEAVKGETINCAIYILDSSGGVHGNFYHISGDTMKIQKWYLYWDENEDPILDNQGALEVVSWKYTKKGWLIYEERVSENPEMDYHVMIRVQPLKDEYRKYCKKYIEPLCNDELDTSLMMPGYPPIPEVVDAVINEDGSLTMQVDGLKQDKGTDYAYSGKVTVIDHGSEGVEYIQDEISKEYKKK